jgi:hypothetical protein
LTSYLPHGKHFVIDCLISLPSSYFPYPFSLVHHRRRISYEVWKGCSFLYIGKQNLKNLISEFCHTKLWSSINSRVFELWQYIHGRHIFFYIILWSLKVKGKNHLKYIWMQPMVLIELLQGKWCHSKSCLILDNSNDRNLSMWWIKHQILKWLLSGQRDRLGRSSSFDFPRMRRWAFWKG